MPVRARNQQIVRQWRLVQLLATGRRTIEQLAVELEVTERTVRRDFEALEEAYLRLLKEDQHWRLLTDRPFGLNLEAGRTRRIPPRPDSRVAQQEVGELRGLLELPQAGGAR